MSINYVTHPKDVDPFPIVLLSFITNTQISLSEADDYSIKSESTEVTGFVSVAKHIGRSLFNGDEQLVDFWLNVVTYLQRPLEDPKILAQVEEINSHLKLRTFFVGHAEGLVDICIWAALDRIKLWRDIIGSNKKIKYKYIVRWFSFLDNGKRLSAPFKVVDTEKKPKKLDQMQHGTFEDLEGAEDGKVVVRFPPEPSGYLHIGHAKAAFVNEYYKKKYNGKMILRFDDTNPRKEKEEFEEAIIHDLGIMGIVPDSVSHTSDYFDVILEKAEELMAVGKAYIDDSSPEEIKRLRGLKENSPNRDNSIEKNTEMWQELKNATERGKTWVLRAKIDMSSDNGTMRDPVIYRFVDMPHNRTGDRFKVYPIYNFACPVVDSIEGVTTACRSNEYHDSEEQYFWFLANVPGLRPVKIRDFSRLNFTYTLMSKRKLAWFVDNNLVEGWHDPRFPTIRALDRRGLKLPALKNFILDLGNSKNAVLMDINKLWAFNKQFIDQYIPRFNVVKAENVVEVIIEDIPDKIEESSVLKCKLNESLGNKTIEKYNRIYLDQSDVASLADGEEFTIMDWGNMILQSKQKTGDVYTSIVVRSNLGGDFKKTKKFTWVANTPKQVRVKLMFYDPLINVPSIPKEKKTTDPNKPQAPKIDFKDYVNFDSAHEVLGISEMALRDLKPGDSIQFTRRGYFVFDRVEDDVMVFINTPDGHDKDVWK